MSASGNVVNGAVTYTAFSFTNFALLCVKLMSYPVYWRKYVSLILFIYLQLLKLSHITIIMILRLDCLDVSGLIVKLQSRLQNRIQ